MKIAKSVNSSFFKKSYEAYTSNPAEVQPNLNRQLKSGFNIAVDKQDSKIVYKQDAENKIGE